MVENVSIKAKPVFLWKTSAFRRHIINNTKFMCRKSIEKYPETIQVGNQYRLLTNASNIFNTHYVALALVDFYKK